MKLLLIHQAYASPEDAGGTRHYEFARHCAECGHQVSIIASKLSYLTGKPTGVDRDPPLGRGEPGVRVRRVYALPSLHRSFVFRVISFLSFSAASLWGALRDGKPDVVMGTSPPLFQAASACLVAALRKRRFVLEVRDLWPEFAIDMGVLTSRPLIAASRWLARLLYKRATHIVVNSPAYRAHIVNDGFPAEKITLIANGTDPKMFEPTVDGESIRSELGLVDKFVVVYAGALGMANDIATILRAAAQLRDRDDIQLVLIGDGKERANLETMAGEMGLDNVLFIGTRSKLEMPKYLAAADACVATLKDIPMFRTTYPNKVFDYMAAAKPIVLGIDGVIREVVESAHCGIPVHPGDDTALASAIEELADDRELASKMGQSGRDYVAQHFNRQDQAEEFRQLIERLVDPACEDDPT